MKYEINNINHVLLEKKSEVNCPVSNPWLKTPNEIPNCLLQKIGPKSLSMAAILKKGNS